MNAIDQSGGRKASTEDLYARLVKRILVRASAAGVEKLPELGEWLRSQSWSVATLRLYRMALIWYLADVGQQGTRRQVGEVLGLEGAVRKRRLGGPGKRRKSEKGWDAVKAWLEKREVGKEVALWMEAAMLAGFRPVEWKGCQMETEKRRLWIPTAKARKDAAGNRVRGVGIEDEAGVVWRYLDYVSEADWQVVAQAMAVRDRLLRDKTAEEVLASYALWLRRGWDAVHGAKRPRITLYSGRHIFAGRLKKSGVDRRTLAAALGQISVRSSKVYGRAQHSKGLHPAKGLQTGIVVPDILRNTVRGMDSASDPGRFSPG